MPSALPYTHRVTKYDPADRDEHGYYVGAEDVGSDHGVVETAYLDAVAAFATDTGITHLTIREPEVTGRPRLPGLFPADLAGFHDGAMIPLSVGLELVRAMLRGNGAWCQLEAEDRFFVHVGYDQYVYVGSIKRCDDAVAFTFARGLFAEPIGQSPLDPEFIEVDDTVRRPADQVFWAELAALVLQRGAVVIEEGYVYNTSRWHRVTSGDTTALQGNLAPRSRLFVWPDLSPDIAGVLANLPPDGLTQLVWEDPDGHITDRTVTEDDYPEISTLLARARSAMLLSGYADERHPLLAAVLPDADGVLRARW